MSATGGSGSGEWTAALIEAPFGWWPSPWKVGVVAGGKVSRSGLQADGDAVYWSESRPDEGGRSVVVRSRPGEVPTDVSPPGVSVRSRVHEYGGAPATVVGDELLYVDDADQGWYRTTMREGEGSHPVALTPAPASDAVSVRYADGRPTASGRWLITIEERVEGATTGHRLVAVAVDGSGLVVPLVERGDFVSAPRPSPDGHWLAWVSWDHPAMPWDESSVWVARLVEGLGRPSLEGAHPVAGGAGSSVGQPRWCRDGSLVYVDDGNGWWLPYRRGPDELGRGARAQRLVDREAEFHAPDWVVGQSTMAELSDGSLVCRLHADGRDHVVRLRPPEASATASVGSSLPQWSVETLDQPCVSIAGLAATTGLGSPAETGPDGEAGPALEEDRVWVLGSTPTESQGVFEIPLRPGSGVRRVSAPPRVIPAAGEVSRARPLAASTPSGDVPGLFYPPANASYSGPAGLLPPLVVFCHGGPTSAAEVGFDPVVQFFTSRGLAVAIVDYRGSSGYGRPYRRALDGLWGEADIDDCVHYASALARAGRVDGSRMAIRGTSAGGLTALGALIRSRRFAGAAAWYGVTDLEALVAETHDFESRYLDALVGPWPATADVYRARSPIHHPEEVSGAVLLLQGADDPVVPAVQSQRFADRLRANGVPCALTVFAGEAHGFRRADTIEASLTAELDFYRSVFGFRDPPARAADTP